MRTPRRRSGDTIGMLLLKWVGGVASGLIIMAVGATGGLLFGLMHRVDAAEYALRYHGLWLGP